MLNIVIALCPCNCYALRESQVLVLLRSGWAHQRRRRGGSDGHGRWVRSASSVLCGEVNIFASGRTHLVVFDIAGPTAPATTSATSARCRLRELKPPVGNHGPKCWPGFSQVAVGNAAAGAPRYFCILLTTCMVMYM